MKQKIFQLLADLRFSIFLLLLICFFSVIGTIIEQDQSIETYKTNYPLINPIFGFLSWDIILTFGLDRIYQTWWFLLLICLFGVSLTLCSFLQQLPALKMARRCQFFRTSKQFYKLKISTLLNRVSISKLLVRLKRNHYSIFQQKNTIYCYKGVTSQIAPVAVHFSMILILFGTIFSSVFGFKSQEIVPKTESFHIQNILTTGKWAKISKSTLRLNDFWIIYTKDKKIFQFYSNMSILNNKGTEIKQKTIRVNYPFIFKNIYYYQTDWNLIGLRFQNSKFNEIIEYPLINILNRKKKVWLTLISTNLELKKSIIAIIDNFEGYCSIYDETGIFLGNIELNENNQRQIFNSSVNLIEIISSTGLQIKTDPGIPIIYLGFLFLLSSVLISANTYSQVWVLKTKKNLFIGGVTNRALFEFELEFFNLTK